MKKKIKEAGDMIASQPGPSLAEPSFGELLAREVERLRDRGEISPVIYYRARHLLPLLLPSMINIFYRRSPDLQPPLAFLLRQARRGTIY